MDVRVVGLKVEDKKHAQDAWKTLHERHEAGETDYVEVLGLWKNKKGKVHAKYYGNHYRLIGTVVGLYFGVIPGIIGYYVGRHYMFKGKVETKALDGLGDFVENGGAAIFALVPEGDAEPLAAWFLETYPGAETEIVDAAVFKSDLDALQAEAEAAGPDEE
ncbi:MAG TPA: hypothetical protein VFH93_10870 [Thermoleophilia bacterium]|jgi:hypothetical protein|nr:hypothetical protein [Thermoleophilia bacterium]